MNKYLAILSKILQDVDPSQISEQKLYLIPSGADYRWIFPTYNKSVFQFVRKWQPYSVKGKVQWILLLLFYRFGLLDFLPNIVKTTIQAPDLMRYSCTYVGTIGIYQKLVISDIRNNLLIKVAVGDRAPDKIRDEYQVLTELSLSPLNCPKALNHNDELNYFVQTIQPGNLSRAFFNNKHIAILNQMPTGTILNSLDQIMPHRHYLIENHSFIKSAFYHLTIPFDTKLTFQHGDFCPWNILEYSGKYQLIDFEEARNNGLPLYDYLYFHVRQAQLLTGENQISLNKRHLLQLNVRVQDIDQLLKLNRAYMIYLAIKNNDIQFAHFINECEFLFI